MIFGPAGLLVCIGYCARGFDQVVTGRAHRDWRRSGGGHESVRQEAADWIQSKSERLGSGSGSAGRPAALRLSAFGFGALAFALPVPIVLLAALSAVGPFVTSVARPPLHTMARVARAEMLLPYVVAADASISPREAGESLHVLSWIGDADREPAPVERRPVRTIAEPWIPAGAPESLQQIERLPRRVFDEKQPLTAIELDWIERASTHPGHDEIARLARASSADIVDTRWNTDAFEGESIWNLPIYRFSSMRQGAYTHIALGMLAAEHGDLATAELRFREVISIGLLLVRSGPQLIDMLIGSVMAQAGADALRGFYESTGRESEAGQLRLAFQSFDRADSAAKMLRVGGSTSLRGLVDIAANENLPPGIRWESLMNAQLTARCQGPSAVLFGPGEGYDEWLAGVNGSLVRYQSDSALFEMIGESRVLPQRPARAWKLVRSLFTLTFGESGEASRCADIAAALASAY
jgi:hypothetical protein